MALDMSVGFDVLPKDIPAGDTIDTGDLVDSVGTGDTEDVVSDAGAADTGDASGEGTSE